MKTQTIDGRTYKTAVPVPFDPEQEPVIRTMPVAEFVASLTDGELGAILQAAKSDTGVSIFIERLRFAGAVIDFDSEHTKKGMAALVAKGLMTQGRADALARK